MTLKAGREAEKGGIRDRPVPQRSRQALDSQDALEREAADDLGLPEEPPEGVEWVPLEGLDGPGDDDEVGERQGSQPEQDSPGDDALLSQEELYEGISSPDESGAGRRGE